MTLTDFQAAKLREEDILRRMVDLATFGVSIVKDGKRVDPHDFYLEPPEKPYTWEG